MQTTLALLLALGSFAHAASIPQAGALLTPSVQAARAAKNSRPTYFNSTCTAETMTVRKEWRNMAAKEKSAYLAAEKCLMSLPAQTTLDGVTSRWSDLQSLHRDLQNSTIAGVYVADIIHNVGQFLPWHRLYVHTHEHMLRTECAYDGPMAWWDEQHDADSGDLYQSEMWGADAFGGNGVGADGCVVDGAFANTTIYIGPGLEDTPEGYCLYRAWDTSVIPHMVTANIDTCTEHNDYYNFMNCMIQFLTSPHVAGHNSTGGMMSDIYASAGDPMFFMHHNYIDRMWWNWQVANASSRMFDVSGNNFNTTFLEETNAVLPASVAQNTTLDYVITVADIIPSVTIETVMNIQGGYLCYEYDY